MPELPVCNTARTSRYAKADPAGIQKISKKFPRGITSLLQKCPVLKTETATREKHMVAYCLGQLNTIGKVWQQHLPRSPHVYWIHKQFEKWKFDTNASAYKTHRMNANAVVVIERVIHFRWNVNANGRVWYADPISAQYHAFTYTYALNWS